VGHWAGIGLEAPVALRYGWRVKRSHSVPASGLALLLAGASLVGCAPAKPPRWAEGGAPLALASARWERGGAGAVELRPSGEVLVDGDLTFVIDRVGRVTDDDYDPVAVLEPDGELVGADHSSLGRIGVTNASPPGVVQAWLSVAPSGEVTYFDPDGERSSGGTWRGCAGPVLRTCTLITQLVALQNYRYQRSSVGVGIGVGVGVGVGFGF
jgi:hypothetical protein